MRHLMILLGLALLGSLCAMTLRAQSASPDANSAVLQQAIKAYDEGDHARVRSLLDPLVKAGTADEVAFLYLGMVAYDADDMATAEALYRKALAINPNYGRAYSELSAALMAQGKSTEAEAMAKKASSADPSNPHAFANLGMAQYSLNKRDEAYKSFLAAAKLDPAVITGAGVEMLTQYNDPDAALYYFNISLAAFPNDPLTLLDAGQAYKMLGNEQKAMELFRRGYENTPTDKEPFGVLYSSYFRLLLDNGQFDTILKEALTRVGPDYPEAALFQSLAYYRLGRRQEFEAAAKRYLALAKQQEPPSLDAWAQGYIDASTKGD